MSHFFNDSSSSETVQVQKKKKKTKKSDVKYTIDNLPTSDKEKIAFITKYLKDNKNIDPIIAQNLLDTQPLTKNLKNVLTKMLKKNEKVEEAVFVENDEETVEEREDVVFERRIGECMESERGIEMLDEHIFSILNIRKESAQEKEPSKFIDPQIFNNFKTENTKLSQLEKLYKAKLSLLNQNIYSIPYLEYKNTLIQYLTVSDLLNKSCNKLFYIKMLIKTNYDKEDLIKYLSNIKEANKIYFDFLFFETEQKDEKLQKSRSDTVIERYHVVIEKEKLDEEFKLIYFIRTDYKKAVEYYKNNNLEYNRKILREFCIRSFQENDLHLTNELIEKFSQNKNQQFLDDKLENIAIVLEIVGIRPLEIIKTKFVMLEKNQLLLRSLNKKMELMRAYFLKINYDYEGCANIIKTVMGVEVGDFIVPEELH